MTVKQVIVVRTDLNMRKGKMSAQAAHASMKVFFDRKRISEGVPRTLSVDLWPEAAAWVEGTFTKVVLGITTEAELIALHERVKVAGLPVALVIDNGYTEFHGVPTPTCLAIGPAEAEAIDPFTRELKLL